MSDFKNAKLKAVAMQSAFFSKQIDKAVQNCMDDPDLNVQKLTRILGMSRTDIHRKLKQIFGMSATEYIRKMRLARACELLKNNPNMPVVDVAFRTGFIDQSYFAKRFKELYGMRPMEFRRQCNPKTKK